jgi:DNA (cytosine-5)-methyltransferase 1
MKRGNNIPSPELNSRLQHLFPTVLDLFSGAGGTGYGFRKAGFCIVGAVEIDHHAAKTYKKNLGVTAKVADIRDFSPRTFRRKLNLRRGELDVLVGCPPCQGFSRMRNGDGADDPRNKLVLRYLEFVREFKPRFAIFENVPGIVRMSHGQKFYKALYDGLEALNYALKFREEDAADYGTPQHRKRVIVIAGRDGEEPPFPTPTHGDPTSEEVRNGHLQKWRTVRDAIGNKYPALSAGENGEAGGRYPNHIAPTTAAKVLDFIKQVPKDGGGRRDVSIKFWLDCHRKHDGHYDVYGRMAWDRPSNTITCGCTNISKGRFVHPEQNRAITPREAAALQGFPDDYTFEGKSVADQIGNAVPPPLAYAIAKAFRERIRRAASSRNNRTSDAGDSPRTSAGLDGRSDVRSRVASPGRGRRRSAPVKVEESTGL